MKDYGIDYQNIFILLYLLKDMVNNVRQEQDIKGIETRLEIVSTIDRNVSKAIEDLKKDQTLRSMQRLNAELDTTG